MASPRNSNRPPRPGTPEEDLEPGTILNDRYRIDVPVGQGAMGKVYAAEHVLLRKKVAVKILRGDRAHVPEVVARFEREAMAAANIEHPNIAGASDFGRLADGSVYLVLEFVQGKNLRDELAKGPLSVPRSLHIARQIVSALAAAEELGIVHRDLKPENVMLVEKLGDADFVKVLDFGIARVPMAETEDRPLTKVGFVFGTPEYMAPEQALGQRVDGRADLFALGVILFEMIAGTRPYTSPKSPALRLAQKTPRLSDRVPVGTIPPELEDLVQKLLAPDAKKRVQNAADALSAIDSVRAALPRVTAARPSNFSAPQVESAPRNPAPNAHMPTFLPGDPLPAFELPSETSRAEIDAPTLLRVASVDGRSSVPPPPVRASAPALSGSTSFGARATALHRAACVFVDAHRDELPRFVRRRVKRVPANTLVAAGAAISALLLLSAALVVVALARTSREEISAPASTTAASPAASGALRSASPEPQASPLPAPTPTESPDDARSLIALAKTRLEEKEEAEALALIGRALAQDSKIAEDQSVATSLAKVLHSDKPSSVDAAFALLEGPMGQRGADAVYDAAFDTKLSEGVRTRANAWLRTKDFDRASSPALYSAVKLRLAESCEQKYGLLKLAENVGGKQTLAYLHELAKHTQCRSGEQKGCYSCLNDAGRLRETIARLEQRLGS